MKPQHKIFDLETDFLPGQTQRAEGRYFNNRLFFGYYRKGLFWMRLFNHYGIHIKDSRRCYETFSERHGYVKVCKIGRWRIRTLTPQQW